MLVKKLDSIKQYAFYLKRVLEANYAPILENSLNYVNQVYNYLDMLLSSNAKQIDNNKAEVFYHKTVKNFNKLNYSLRQLGCNMSAA